MKPPLTKDGKIVETILEELFLLCLIPPAGNEGKFVFTKDASLATLAKTRKCGVNNLRGVALLGSRVRLTSLRRVMFIASVT